MAPKPCPLPVLRQRARCSERAARRYFAVKQRTTAPLTCRYRTRSGRFPARWESAGVGFSDQAWCRRSCPRVEAIDRSRPSTGSSPPIPPRMVPWVEAIDRCRPSTRRYRTRPGVAPAPCTSIRVSAHDRPNLSETNGRGSIRFRPTGRRRRSGKPAPAFSIFT